jgi:hypothetical protein
VSGARSGQRVGDFVKQNLVDVIIAFALCEVTGDGDSPL